VSPANANELVIAIEQLLGSSGLRRQLGLAGQQTVRSYTWDRVTKKLEKILELAIQNEKR
jgi:glycosyltransferase involved in cell wall biosynthesis